MKCNQSKQQAAFACPLCAVFSSFPQSIGVSAEAPNKSLCSLSIPEITRSEKLSMSRFFFKLHKNPRLIQSLSSECGSQQEVNVCFMPRLDLSNCLLAGVGMSRYSGVMAT